MLSIVAVVTVAATSTATDAVLPIFVAIEKLGKRTNQKVGKAPWPPKPRSQRPPKTRNQEKTESQKPEKRSEQNAFRMP